MNENNNLNQILHFIKKNKNFSDYNQINDLLFNLNFTKYRNNNQTGGLVVSQPPIQLPLPQLPSQTSLNDAPEIHESIPQQMVAPMPQQMVAPMPSSSLTNVVIKEDLQIRQPILEEETDKISIEIDNLGSNNMKHKIGIEDEDCTYKEIKNSDGTVTKQKICNQKIVTMPDMLLSKPSFLYSKDNSEVTTYTLKKGMVLYHASKLKSFNPNRIKLGQDKLIAYFTPNMRLASGEIGLCDENNQNSYIHTFQVKQDIPNIYIILPYDSQSNMSLDEIKNKFCDGDGMYKGIGFFFPINHIEQFSNSYLNQSNNQLYESSDDEKYYSKFAICNPNDYLEYICTKKCKGLYVLSDDYKFDE